MRLKELKKINQINNHQDISAYFSQSNKLASNPPFSLFIDIDPKQPKNYITFLTQSGLGLPDRDYYLKTDPQSTQLKTDYVEHITTMLSILGLKQTKNKAKKIMVLETAIANIHWSRNEQRDRDKTYNKIKLSDLSKLFPNFNWKHFINESKIPNQAHIIIREISYFKPFTSLFSKTSVNDWKDYFKWHLINTYSTNLTEKIYQSHFDFYSTKLSGIPTSSKRWKRAVNSVDKLIGEIVAKPYVKKYFQPQAKKKMIQLVENLRAAYKNAIINLDWMGEKTKKQALIKLEKFNPKIGYPNKWIDYSQLIIKEDDLVGNYIRASQFHYQREINKLDQPINKEEWAMTPQTVNAYYNPSINEIVFPAAILQPPFFNMNADDAINYGAIGAVIGHEMGHGFDDQGAKSDGDGVLKNWWTQADLNEFKKRTQKLADQYSLFEALPNEFINGDLTLGENIGDLGGLTIAFKAYKISQINSSDKIIDGFTGEQRFFIGWAQVWAYKYREKALRNRLTTDPHSPANFRVNGPLMNMPEFIKAYDVKAKDKMFREEKDRVKIW